MVDEIDTTTTTTSTTATDTSTDVDLTEVDTNRLIEELSKRDDNPLRYPSRPQFNAYSPRLRIKNEGS